LLLTTASVATPSGSGRGEPPRSTVVADVVLYDGVCALCHGIVRFLVRRDRAQRFRYAPLQSEFARTTLARFGADAGRLSTVFLVLDYGTREERLLQRSRAALAAMRRIGGGWAGAARVLSLVPSVVLDAAYGLVARTRYAIFGRYDSCPLPAPEQRHLFLDSALNPTFPQPKVAPGGEPRSSP
jgi:predicted DCC family thiol-disulfide oxidoreductase YuxK